MDLITGDLSHLSLSFPLVHILCIVLKHIHLITSLATLSIKPLGIELWGNIHALLKMTPNGTMRFAIVFLSESSQQLLDGLPQNLIHSYQL